MVTVLKIILLTVIPAALTGWVSYILAKHFLDDLGGPGDGTGYT